MKKILLFMMVALFSITGARASTIDKLISNINEMTLQSKADTQEAAGEFIAISNHGNFNDAMIIELYVAVTISDKEAGKYITTIKPDGSWPDINYTDTQRSRWDPATHITRIHSIAKSYKTPASQYYQSPEALAVLHKALHFWFSAGLVCPNWWYNEIGVPKMLGPALLLLKDELTTEEKQGGEAVLAKATFKMTGQNKVWLSGNILMRGLLTDDLALVQQARDSIVSEIYVSTDEGLQPDNSFHQHGAQMQFGNYGLAYAGTISYWARVLNGTPLAVSAEQLAYLRNYVLAGLQWTVWRGYMDVSASARQVFKNAQRGKALSVAVTALNMISIDPEHAREYKQYIYGNQINPRSPNLLVGLKYFPRSDFAIHRAPAWYASVRMHSNRLIGYEMTNKENLQGVYSSDGAMMLMIDGDEYNNIYPVWNWKRLPGTTVADDGKPIAYFHPRGPVNITDFAGGVTDGAEGVAALEVAKDGLAARKAYFFIDDLVVCTGSGITAKEPLPIFTTLNQTLLKGGVTYGEKNTTQILGHEQRVASRDIKWAHHNGVGYWMFQNENVALSNQMQHGNWGSIAEFYGDAPQSSKVFSMVIEHPVKASASSYAYVVLPNRTADETEQFAQKPLVMILSNSASCQAVSNLSGSKSQYVFYGSDVLKMADGVQIAALTPALLMIESTPEQMKIVASDPTQKFSEIKLTLSGNFKGENSVYDTKTKETTIVIPMPTEPGARGSSVAVVFQRLN